MMVAVLGSPGQPLSAEPLQRRPEPSPALLAVRPVRLATGLMLLTYLFLHLVNHALGIVSLGAAEAGLKVAKALWQSWPGTFWLYGAAAVHFSLALFTLYERRNWRLPPIEWLRLYAGFSLPILMIDHAVNTRLGADIYQYDPEYRNVIATIVASGKSGWQLALLAPGWLHGCLGVWIGLRRRTWAQRAKPALIAFTVGLPLLSTVGFLQMRAELESDPSGGGAAYYAPAGPSGQRMLAELKALRGNILLVYLGLVAGAIAAGFVHRRVARPSV